MSTDGINPVKLSQSVRTVLFHGQDGIAVIVVWAMSCAYRLWKLYRIYSIPTYEKHQWLLLQFIVLLMMDAKRFRNM